MASNFCSSARTRTPILAVVSVAALVFAVLGMSGCGGSAPLPPKPTASTPAATSSATSSATFPVTITDDASRSVTLQAEPKRIVSLAPANTEILFALGAGDRVVGVTSYDDYPSQVASITKVGDFAGPNVEAVAAAKPDLILATSGVQADVVKKLTDLGAVVVVLDPQTLDGVYTDIERVGKITGATTEAAGVVSSMHADVEMLAPPIAAAKQIPTVFIEMGQAPLYTTGTGTLMDDLIRVAGGKNVVTQSGYVPYSPEQLIKADPQVYFATKGSSNDPAAIEKRPGYSALSAVKNHRVVILDDSLVSRGGPRIVQGIEQIFHALHPDAIVGK